MSGSLRLSDNQFYKPEVCSIAAVIVTIDDGQYPICPQT